LAAVTRTARSATVIQPSYLSFGVGELVIPASNGVDRLVRVARLCMRTKLIRIGGDPNLAPNVLPRRDSGAGD
jgi:hypothetical protein